MLKILLAGEGGQGIQSIAEIATKLEYTIGKKVSYIPSFGVEQRGGVSLAYIIIDDQSVKYPRFSSADIVLMMCNRATSIADKFLSDNSILIFDGSDISDSNIKPLQGKYKEFLNIPARQMALKEYSTKVTNMLMLGALLHYLNVDITQAFNVMNEKFTKAYEKQPELKELNEKAVKAGMDYANNRPSQEFAGSRPELEETFYEDEKKSWKNSAKLCKGCSLCIVNCPVKALTFSDKLNFLGTQTPTVDIGKCIGCGKCQLVCPEGAIEVKTK